MHEDRPEPALHLGAIRMVATTLYVQDLGRSVDWYRDVLGLEPAELTEDEFPYARYRIGGATVVLEPSYAATDPVDSEHTGAAALNVVVDVDLTELRDGLTGRDVDCTPIHDSPAFATFLVRDPDGHRVYFTSPRS